MTDEQRRLRREDVNAPTSSSDDPDDTQDQDVLEAEEVLAEDAPYNEPSVHQVDLAGRKYIAYTVKLPSDQLAALQSIWLELKRLYGAHSPDKSGMIQQAVEDWLKRWDGPDRRLLLDNLLKIRQDTRRRQYKKAL